MSDRSEVRDPMAPVIDRAVDLARQPAAPAIAAGSNFANDTDPAPAPGTRNDGNGNTIFALMWDLSSWDAGDWS